MKDNLQLATKYLYESIQGRYVTATHLDSFLETLPPAFKISTVGFSVKQQPIKAIEFGEGKVKILIWSQMHGNESTTTKGLFDYLHYLHHNENEFEESFKISYLLYNTDIESRRRSSLYKRKC